MSFSWHKSKTTQANLTPQKKKRETKKKQIVIENSEEKEVQKTENQLKIQKTRKFKSWAYYFLKKLEIIFGIVFLI